MGEGKGRKNDSLSGESRHINKESDAQRFFLTTWNLANSFDTVKEQAMVDAAWL